PHTAPPTPTRHRLHRACIPRRPSRGNSTSVAARFSVSKPGSSPASRLRCSVSGQLLQVSFPATPCQTGVSFPLSSGPPPDPGRLPPAPPQLLAAPHKVTRGPMEHQLGSSELDREFQRLVSTRSMTPPRERTFPTKSEYPRSM